MGTKNIRHTERISGGVTNVQKTLRISRGCTEGYTCRQTRQENVEKPTDRNPYTEKYFLLNERASFFFSSKFHLSLRNEFQQRI